MDICGRQRICVAVCAITLRCSRQSVQCFALCCHTNVRVVGQHLWRNVPRNGHYSLVARLRLGELGHSMVTKIVEAESLNRALHVAYVCFALFVLAVVTRVLLLAAGRAVNRPGHATPSRSPTCYAAS